ncbi:MAG: hypothetical protein IT330_15480 [Anaerolineae bacterium]|nr:hypothetical protein [Anaerolineae bacterium]
MTANPPAGEGDTLYYTRWDGVKWTEPIDVLVSPQGAIEWPDMVITPDGMLHLVWDTSGTDGVLFYARAPACCADDLHRWSEPVALQGPMLGGASAILADPQGRIHVLYCSLRSGSVMYMRSDDGGRSWSEPVAISGLDLRNDEFTNWPRLAMDDRGRLHAVWTVMPWPGRAVMYARSDDGGQSWRAPQVIDTASRSDYANNTYGPIYIDVATRGEDEVYLIWDGAPTVERNHTWSADGGKTWSSRTLLFPEITGSGRSGWNDMVVDSAGTLHAITLGGPFHATWEDPGWSASYRIPMPALVSSGAELVRVAISRGNVLHVVWLKKDARPFTVWYARGQSTAPQLPVQPLRTPTTEPTRTPLPALSLLPTRAIPSPTPLPKQLTAEIPPRPPLLTNPTTVALLGAVPAFLLIVIIVAVRLRQKQWR